MVAAQGGPADFVERHEAYLPQPTLSKAVYADRPGIVSSMDTRSLGMAVVSMGGGRQRASDSIDYSLGLSEIITLGEQADAARPLAIIHASSEASWQQAAVKAAVTLSDSAPEVRPVVYRRVSASDC